MLVKKEEVQKILKTKLSEKNYKKLMHLPNPKLHAFIAQNIQLAEPAAVYVCDDSAEDADYIRKQALKMGEETPLAIKGHTYHFDGINDLARDKTSTRYLLRPSVFLGSDINSTDRDTGLEEIRELLKGCMRGKEMIVRFFCLGPTKSDFSIPCVQITDSYYVSHSEGILYRSGYEEFSSIGDSEEFFRFMHTAGELENGISKNTDKRRMYIDLEEDIVYSANTQYAGNTIGLKKLAMRLAIQKASLEHWLTEHMFIMGVRNLKDKKRLTYFTGSFPSACGKTSTAMLEGETIVGDDIAYLRHKKGCIRAVNVECGIFGIIEDVNSKGDPSIYEALTTEGEVIFSNVLVTNEGVPHWLGKDGEIPNAGINYSGEWTKGKKDATGGELPCSHKNARYTIGLSKLKNKDEQLDNPEGVPIGGIIYGGRDSDTSVPVEEAFGWSHGILTKAATIESETTAATLGKQGVRTFNLMANIDFLSIPFGKYIQNNLDFGNYVEEVPRIFSVNYFLRDEKGKYLNGVKDKHAWLKWMEMRVHGEVRALRTPTGYIPKFDDLKMIFKTLLNKEFTKEDYEKQFTLRIPENLAKIERIEHIYRTKVPDTPVMLFNFLDTQKHRLLETREKFGEYVSPFLFEEV